MNTLKGVLVLAIGIMSVGTTFAQTKAEKAKVEPVTVSEATYYVPQPASKGVPLPFEVNEISYPYVKAAQELFQTAVDRFDSVAILKGTVEDSEFLLQSMQMRHNWHKKRSDAFGSQFSYEDQSGRLPLPNIYTVEQANNGKLILFYKFSIADGKTHLLAKLWRKSGK